MTADGINGLAEMKTTGVEKCRILSPSAEVVTGTLLPKTTVGMKRPVLG